MATKKKTQQEFYGEAPTNLDNHIFAYEAGLIAKAAKVHKLMLTHFYPEIDKQKYANSYLFEELYNQV